MEGVRAVCEVMAWHAADTLGEDNHTVVELERLLLLDDAQLLAQSAVFRVVYTTGIAVWADALRRRPDAPLPAVNIG